MKSHETSIELIPESAQRSEPKIDLASFHGNTLQVSQPIRDDVVVLGDLMLDEFVWGDVTRISPEAPVPVVEIRRESVHLGGAANVLANLVALGAQACVVGVVGKDAAG